MAKIKSEFLKNLNKIKKMRGFDGSDFKILEIILSKDISGFFPANQSECDALLLLGSYPLIDRQGTFKVDNSLLSLCKNNHPSLQELFDFIELNDSERAIFLSLLDKYNVDFLEYYNLCRNEKDHDDLSTFSLSAIRDFCFSVAEKSTFGSVVSHPAKMTDPSCKKPRIRFEGSNSCDGFLRTGNADVECDLHINATQLIVFKFLALPYKGRTLLDCIKNNESDALSEIFSLDSNGASHLIEAFSECLNLSADQSSSNIRQVYFPSFDGYHLLSTLTPSGLVFALKNKIEWINQKSPESYLGRKSRKDGKKLISGYKQIFNLTEIRHGGDHPKNVSGLNNT